MVEVHRLVDPVVEHHDQQREFVCLGRVVRRDDRVVGEGTVADREHHRALLGGEFDAERDGYALSEAALHVEVRVGRVGPQMTPDDPAVGDGLIDDDPVPAVEQFAQGGGEEDGVDALGPLLGLRLRGGHVGSLGGGPDLLCRTALGDRRLVEVPRPFRELAKGVGDVAFQVGVGEQDLMDNVRALRHLVDDDDPRLGGSARGRVEGRTAVDEEDEVRLVHPGTDVRARVQGVGAREVGAHRRVRLDDRDVPGLGEGDQRLEAARLAAGRLGHDHGIAGLSDQLRDSIGLFGRTVRGARRHDGLGLAAVPLLQEDLQRDVEVGGSRWGAPGQFRRPGDHRGQSVDARGLVGPLGERLRDAVRAAHDRQVAVPLAARVLAGPVAVRRRLRGGHHHRHSGEQRPVHGHGALQQAGCRVQQHTLRAAPDESEAGGHADGDGLVRQVEVPRTGQPVAVAPGQGLPDRGPLGTGRAEEVVGAGGLEGRYEGVAAVDAVATADAGGVGGTGGTRGARGVGRLGGAGRVLGVRHLRRFLSPRSASRGPRRFRGP